MQRGLSPTHLHVVAVERDVDGAELDLLPAELRDQPAQALRERDTACLDADERDAVEIRVSLDDLVRDARERALDRFAVEKDLFGGHAGRAHVRGFGLAGTGRCNGLLSGLSGPGLKGFGSGGTLAARPDDSQNAVVRRLLALGLAALAVAALTAGIAQAALWLNFSRASAEPGGPSSSERPAPALWPGPGRGRSASSSHRPPQRRTSAPPVTLGSCCWAAYASTARAPAACGS